jgi:hypothetical protein
MTSRHRLIQHPEPFDLRPLFSSKPCPRGMAFLFEAIARGKRPIDAGGTGQLMIIMAG